ncbi:MAG: CHAT domain-containing protein [Chloroflexi bacterium]|nr:CHAT domain-containing protein [Chloroflexota bacterium]
MRVPLTPGVGESSESAIGTVPASLPRLLQQLEDRRLGVPEIIELGEVLAQILFPAPVRDLLIRSLDRLETGQGLRLRLQLTPSLFSIPWEYLYLQRGRGEKDAVGFLALDPRISIVRHQPLPAPAPLDRTPQLRRLLVVMASPESDQYAPLDLARERAIFEAIRDNIPGLNIDYLEQATIDRLTNALASDTDIVHFAGHGDFERTGLGKHPFSSVGKGVVVFVSDGNHPDLVTADQFAVNLGGRGVQLVVLGACQTGRRDRENVWSSVAAALMERGIPAAIAMQDTIWNESAVAFSRGFYQALAVGLILDEAVCAGRLAVFNRWHPLREDIEHRGAWRDWGVPVLYLRPQQDLVMPVKAQTSHHLSAQISTEERTYLESELAQHRRNLLLLRQQKAIYAEGDVPLRLLNQIDAEERAIQELENRMSEE